MRVFGWHEGAAGLWRLPAVAGLALIALAVLPVLFPKFFSYLFAALLVVAGVVLLNVAWRMRRGVTYHRIDWQWTVRDDEPPGRV
ncbi:MAG: hypothetical protein AB1716_00795 [Planctomycetota bacterium]